MHGVVAPDRSEALFALVQLTTPETVGARLRCGCRGLDPGRRYRVQAQAPGDLPDHMRAHPPAAVARRTAVTLPGAVLAHAGAARPALHPEQLLLLRADRRRRQSAERRPRMTDSRSTHRRRPDAPPPSPQPVEAAARDDTRLALLFILPALIGFLVFMVWPTLRGIYLSFTKFNLLTPPEFNGLDNYIRMVQDPVFWNAMRVTLYYVVINIGLQTVLALVIAVMMQRLTKRTWLRGIVLTPYLVSNVVAAMVFLWILDYQLGIGNNILAAIGIDRIAFLSSEAWVIPTIALINVWRHVGYTALLIFAGLQTIPETRLRGRPDGRRRARSRMFRSITVPLLRPILALVLIITVVGSFQVFDTVAITTRGGPVDSSRVLQYYIYDVAFGRFQFGYASAMSVALLVVLVIITFVQYRLTRADTSDLD